MIQSAYATLCFKLRHFVPCVVCRVQVRIALPADATVELLLTGEAGVGSVDGVGACVTLRGLYRYGRAREGSITACIRPGVRTPRANAVKGDRSFVFQ